MILHFENWTKISECTSVDTFGHIISNVPAIRQIPDHSHRNQMMLIRPQLVSWRLTAVPVTILQLHWWYSCLVASLLPEMVNMLRDLDRDRAAESFQNTHSIGKHLALQPLCRHSLTRPFMLGKLPFKDLFQEIFSKDSDLQQDDMFDGFGEQDNV